ncbi:hypothetical protein [Spirosoma rhododendri]|nr:hypothetical protein [Spirosoma rhododendri]
MSALAVSSTQAQTANQRNSEPIQLASAGPRPGGPRPPHHQPGGPGAPQPQAITSLTTLTGTVNQLTANDDGILNGFTLNASPATTVRFATHLGQQVNATLKPGSQVTVMGYQKTGPTGETTFQLVKMTAGKTQLVDTAPVKPQTPATPAQQTITGKIADYQLGRDGQANALILADQTIVKVPPHVAGQLTTLAPKGSTITVDGYAQSLGEGQVQLQKHNIVRASVLTVAGQSYLVR